MKDDVDTTEAIRRERLEELNQANARVRERKEAEARYGQVWSTEDLQRDFEVLGFLAPYVVVRRRSDGLKGSLEFQHSPRFYFNWQAD